jgi:DNA-binding GntR family transcriptional regulator
LEDSKQPIIDGNYETDKDIHNLILKSSNNRYFISLLDNIFDQNHRLRILSGQRVQKEVGKNNTGTSSNCGSTYYRDWEKAAQDMVLHLENSRNACN